MKKTRIGIIGSTGYVGAELVRLLATHPYITLQHLTSKSFSGQAFSDIYPALRGICDLKLEEDFNPAIANDCDLVITALPHGVSAKLVPTLLQAGLKVIDHSGDFRFRNFQVYEEAYKLTHPAPELLSSAVYGLPELYRSRLESASLVANPGCYPTCSLLALAPLIANNVIDSKGIIIDAFSGISGAGRKSDLAFSFCESTESIKPYGVISHRHTPEIEQELGFLAGKNMVISFTPHLAPIRRGMLASVYADLVDPGTAISDLENLFAEFYKDEPFVRLLDQKTLPETRYVENSNFIDIAIRKDERTGKIKIFSAIDNLGKGAAAQAVQALNIMQGYDETTGLAPLHGEHK